MLEGFRVKEVGSLFDLLKRVALSVEASQLADLRSTLVNARLGDNFNK